MAKDNSTTYSIYRIVCWVNCKVYVGLTSDVERRRKEHFSALRRGDHCNEHLQKSFNKYGETSFFFETLEKDIPQADIAQREMLWIEHFDSYNNGFNNTFGGDSGGHRNVPCVWNGIEYESYTEAALALGVTIGAIQHRMDQGYTCDDDLRPGKVCIWNGVQYNSVVHAARALGVSNSGMQHRLNAGYTCDADIPDKREKVRKTCVWDGIEYPSQKIAAKMLGVSETALARYLKRGYSGSQDLPPDARKPVEWNGIHYSTIREAARALCITPATLAERIARGHKCDADVKQYKKRNNGTHGKTKSVGG